MAEVSVKYAVIRDGVEITQLQAVRGSGASIAVTADAEIKWTLTGKFAPNTTLNYLIDRIRPYLTIDGITRPLGVFVPTDASVEDNGTHKLQPLTAYDITYLAKSSKIEERLHLAAGTLYTDAIRMLMVESGISDIMIEQSDSVLQTDREDWDPGTDRLTIANALAAECNYRSLWMDAQGVVRGTLIRSLSTDAITVTYRDDRYSLLYPEETRTIDLFDHSNVFIVVVDNPDMEGALRAVSINDRPDSPFSTISVGRRIAQYTKLDNIASAQELQVYADNLMFASLQSTETRQWYTGPSAEHSVFDVVALYKGDVSALYAETGWQLDLEAPYRMTHTGRRVLYL